MNLEELLNEFYEKYYPKDGVQEEKCDEEPVISFIPDEGRAEMMKITPFRENRSHELVPEIKVSDNEYSFLVDDAIRKNQNQMRERRM